MVPGWGLIVLGVRTEFGVSVGVQVRFGVQAGTGSSFVVRIGVRLGLGLRFNGMMAIFSFSI